MAILLVKCPHTDRPISTGIEIHDAETLINLPDVCSRINVALSTSGGRGRLGLRIEWKFHRLRTRQHKGAMGQLRGRANCANA